MADHRGLRRATLSGLPGADAVLSSGDGDDDLEAQQRAFFASNTRPAASISTSISKSASTSTSTSAAATGTAAGTAPDAAPPARAPAGMPAAMPAAVQPVMGTVAERSVRVRTRDTAAPTVAIQPDLVERARAALPLATGRRPTAAARSGPRGPSLFARRFDQTLAGVATSSQAETEAQTQTQAQTQAQTETTVSRSAEQSASGGMAASLGTDAAAEAESMVQRMTPQERQEAMEEAARLLSPEALALLRQRTEQRRATAAGSASASVTAAVARSAEPAVSDKAASSFVTPEGASVAPEEAARLLPFKVDQRWLNMNVVEKEKLAWMADDVSDAATERSKDPRPMRRNQVRFDFTGKVVPPDTDLPTHLGLHHHADQPAQAGYSLSELCETARSAVTSQRILALETLAAILHTAAEGGYDANGACDSAVIWDALMGMGISLFLRKAMDDPAHSVCVAGTKALAALLCTPQHEALLDARYDTDAGHEVPPQRPQAPADDEEGEATAPQKDTAHPSKNKTFDIMEAQKDLVEAVVTMDLLPRIRYLVEVAELKDAYPEVLDMLIRVVRHGASSTNKVFTTPRLMDTLRSVFFETTLGDALAMDAAVPRRTPPAARCRAHALKLLRVLCQGSRNVSRAVLEGPFCDHVVASMLAPLALGEAEPLTIGAVAGCVEACRMLSAILSYGLGGDLVTHNFSHLLDLARKSLAADAGSDMAAVASAALGVLAAAIPLAACPEETEPRHALHWVNMEGLPTVARVIVATLAPRLAVQAEDVAVANDRGAKTLVPLATVVAGALRLLALYHRCDTHIRGTAGSVDAAGLLRAQEGALADALGVAAPVLRGPLPSLLYPTSTATSLPGDLPAGPFPASRRVAPNNPAACTCLAEAQLHATRGVLVDVLLQATALLQMTAAQNKAILQDPEIQACLALPLWDQMFKAAVGAVAGPTTDGVQATAQVEGFAPAPLRLFAAQLENRCWRRAVALHNAAGATAKTSDVSLALLVQCPGGEAHQALDLLSLSPLGRRAGEPSVGVDRTGRVRASLRKMLLGGPLNDTAVQRDRKARSGMHPRNRASCFLPEAPHMGDEQTLPLSPLCMYWPLQMLYNAAAMVEDRILSEADSNMLAADVAQALMLLVELFQGHCSFMLAANLSTRLRLVMQTFLMPGALYHDPHVAEALTALLPLVACGGHLGTDTDVKRLYDMLLAAIEEYIGNSLGSELLGRYLLVPLQRLFPADFREALYCQEQFLRFCTLGLEAVVVPLENMLYPLETSRPLLDLYSVALHGKVARNSALYLMALHHTAAFVFRDFGDASILQWHALEGDPHADDHREHLLQRFVAALDDVTYRDLLFYTDAVARQPARNMLPLDTTGEIPASRREALLVAATTATARRLLSKRHPSWLEGKE